MIDRFDDEALARFRSGIMKQGQKLSILLSDVLAGKQPPSLRAILDAKPGLRPEEALRQQLDQVESRRKMIDARDDRYGRCDVCGADLGAGALGEMPWADRCIAHAGV